MIVLDSGHLYKLEVYDGDLEQILRFMKREGPIYPGNVGNYPGTNIKEVIRVLIHRLKYVDKQIHSLFNDIAIRHLRDTLVALERRAADRHGLNADLSFDEIENQPSCKICGHIVCHHLKEKK